MNYGYMDLDSDEYGDHSWALSGPSRSSRVVPAPEPAKPELVVSGVESFLQGVKQLRDDQKFCDFVVECGDLKLPVHRVVLCSRSDYFKRACGGGFSVRFPPSLIRSFSAMANWQTLTETIRVLTTFACPGSE